MLNITLLHVGEFKEKYLKDAFLEYKKRISGFATFEDINIKESYLSSTPSESEIEKALSSESKLILGELDQKAKKIALCVEGKEFNSEEFAEIFSKAAIEGKSKIIFVIGSSYGLSEEVKKACDLKLSFSKMTFPHQLMRVILSEQIYRAMTINAGKNYHK